MHEDLNREKLREYDAHIYFSAETLKSAQSLRQRMAAHFEGEEVLISEMKNSLVGPHPMPMFEANFGAGILSTVTEWLRSERGCHSVLIHPVTGDDFRDHSEAVTLWLGERVSLDFSKF